MKKESVYMGTLVRSWMDNKRIKNVTFSVTDNCNLMCKYCYFTHKTDKNKMTFDVAKRTVDYLLSDESSLLYDGVIWDFIGGEPTLEMDLIDQICDYILYKMYTENHKWLFCYRIMIGTNGLLYASQKFQRFLFKHNINLHVAITIDGTKEKHDLSRIKKDGSGSYDDVVSIIPLWIKQTGNISTKSTFSHEDLPYLKDSIINLWNMGLKCVAANVVFEDVWHDGDDLLFESQLKQLADYIIENRLWNQYSVRFFSPTIGYPTGDQEAKINYCGSGNMLAVDHRGTFYPCVRFMDSALSNRTGRAIGTCGSGINSEAIRAFNALSHEAQSTQECMDCPISSGCSWCTGLNYDESDDGSIFARQTYICKMHKANVRANQYFWKRYEQATNFISPLRYNMYTNRSKRNRYIYILQNNRFSFCQLDSQMPYNEEMSEATYKQVLAFCDEHNYIPVHVGFNVQQAFGYYIGDHHAKYERDGFTVDVVEHGTISEFQASAISQAIIYRTNSNSLDSICEDIETILTFSRVRKISVTTVGYQTWEKKHLLSYAQALEQLVKLVYKNWIVGRYIQIDVITNSLFTDERTVCLAGTSSFTVSPAGDIYPCSAYYYAGKKKLGNVWATMAPIDTTHPNLLMCQRCEVNNCNKCNYLNEMVTYEKHVPFEAHCVKANLELNASCKLLHMIKDNNIRLPFDVNDRIRESRCLDPLIDLRGDTFINKGLYKVGEQL